MKTVIYQYWDGPTTSGNEAGRKAMKEYADRIGSDYIYEHEPKFVTNLGRYSPHYGSFKPIYTESFHEYDYVMFADTDVFPVEGLEENIFEQFYDTDYEIGICEEWNAPDARVKHTIGGINNYNDEQWVKLIEDVFNVKMPRNEKGLPRVYNSGVVVYSNYGLLKAKYKFTKFEQYVTMVQTKGLPSFYTCDQPYLHAMLEIGKFKWKTMDYKWNSSVHYKPGTKGPQRPVNDLRDNANLVHIQLGGADNLSESTLHRITNLPVDQWQI